MSAKSAHEGLGALAEGTAMVTEQLSAVASHFGLFHSLFAQPKVQHFFLSVLFSSWAERVCAGAWAAVRTRLREELRKQFESRPAG